MPIWSEARSADMHPGPQLAWHGRLRKTKGGFCVSTVCIVCIVCAPDVYSLPTGLLLVLPALSAGPETSRTLPVHLRLAPENAGRDFEFYPRVCGRVIMFVAQGIG